MSPSQKPDRWIVVLCLASLALILCLRLIPFVFVWDGHVPVERIQWQPLMLLDIPFNILIFIPFGIGLAGVLVRHAQEALHLPAIGRQVVLAGVLLSTILETVQIFMPERVPSLADIVANGIGALLGYGLFRAWQTGFGRVLVRYVTGRNLLLGLGCYAFGVALLTAYLVRGVHLNTWDSSFPLVIGNEATGDRPWYGRIEYLELEAAFDGSPEYAAHYLFTGEAPFEDVIGNPVPPLEWRVGPATLHDGRGINIGPDEWLSTTGAFSGFSAAVRRTDEFTIRMAVATASPDLREYRRIVSISTDVYHRNISLIQMADALVIRLRTVSNGENGHRPEISVPSVFTDTRPRHITVAYSAPLLRVTVDNELFALSLGPGLVFFSDIKQGNFWVASMTGFAYRYDIYYGLIMVGPAIATTGGLLLAKHKAGRGR